MRCRLHDASPLRPGPGAVTEDRRNLPPGKRREPCSPDSVPARATRLRLAEEAHNWRAPWGEETGWLRQCESQRAFRIRLESGERTPDITLRWRLRVAATQALSRDHALRACHRRPRMPRARAGW